MHSCKHNAMLLAHAHAHTCTHKRIVTINLITLLAQSIASFSTRVSVCVFRFIWNTHKLHYLAIPILIPPGNWAICKYKIMYEEEEKTTPKVCFHLFCNWLQWNNRNWLAGCSFASNVFNVAAIEFIATINFTVDSWYGLVKCMFMNCVHTSIWRDAKKYEIND